MKPIRIQRKLTKKWRKDMPASDDQLREAKQNEFEWKVRRFGEPTSYIKFEGGKLKQLWTYREKFDSVPIEDRKVWLDVQGQ